MHRRDFRLFDFDESGDLTPDEFSCLPGLVHPSERGPVPDPFDDMLDVALETLDELLEGWADEPEREIFNNGFVFGFLKSFSPEMSSSDTASQMRIADANRDNKLTWDEAKRYVEIQLGIRSEDGTLLRESSGRVLVYSRFEIFDADKNGGVTLEEFRKHRSGSNAEPDFQKGDRNGDGQISVAEFSHPEWVEFYDPILTFRRGDTDFDGLLSESELEKVTESWRQKLVPFAIPAFDDDGDGKLSLREFRLSFIGNYMAVWESPVTDKNRDQRLTFDEYTPQQADCRLLCRYYFNRLDANGDLELKPDEYAYEVRLPLTLHRMTLDGKDFRQIYESEALPFCGSPAVSPDGQFIMFDAYPPSGLRDARVIRITIDGEDETDLCDGLMPTWSPDGQRFSCTTYGDTNIRIRNRDGSDDIDIGDGWGAQWSPDGRSICFTKSSRSIWVYDVETRQSREVLPKADHEYRLIYWNMVWSPDSSRLLFKAYKQNSKIVDIATISMTGEHQLTVHMTTDRSPDNDMAWFPDGEHVLVNMATPDLKQRLLYKWKLGSEEPTEPLHGIDRSLRYNNVTISPDQKWIIMSTARDS
ncbi:hypothetical protein [Rubinisphaera margarita]|uniref:hypothetical protein n=1 Tax=Rubinisphaera margarita TaxID=2909586 RepID=UPI001EE88076|nr:hypothetical protein [Rubinisphaera margarita]MCG6156400.1 hypothetical protein [Rubinisphaera margarita]